MKTYKVTFIFKGSVGRTTIEIRASDIETLKEFIDRFYPDTNWTYDY